MRRSTIILLIVFVLLGGLVWYMQQPENTISKAIATSTVISANYTENLFDPLVGPILLITIRDQEGKTVTLDKSSGSWTVQTDQIKNADQMTAESVSVQALDLKIIKRFDEPPAIDATGLDKPDYVMTFKLTDNSLFTLKIGNLTVTGSGYYAQTSDEKIIILRRNDMDYLIKNFSQPPLDETETPAPDGIPATVTPTP